MAYSLKKRKQLSKSSKKNKTKLRKAKKTNRTRRFRKQYGGNLDQSQKEYIEDQIKDLEFTEAQKRTIFRYFDIISSHVSKESSTNYTNDGSTVLHDFFVNVKSNYGRNITVEAKREIFLVGLFEMYNSKREELDIKTPFELKGLLGRKK
uniref:Uncharacterized protein n=1 Tax=viral metagenome TaxID=1070528 RepID=A0A6C0E7B6_9ZZZZ